MPIDPSLYRKIQREISAGLRQPAEYRRVEDARKNLWCLHGNWDMLPVEIAKNEWDKIRPRYSLIMHRIVSVLCGNLYREGPARVLPEHKEASEWLNNVYRANLVDAMWQRADVLSTATDAAAFQVVKSSDPARPLRLYLWDASQFYVWCDPEDPTSVQAVAVVDLYDEHRRLRLWTDSTLTTYTTEKLGPGQTQGGTMYRLVSEKEHDYGVLPFSFVHFNLPLCEFWSAGPGTHFRQVNESVNALLTQLGGSVNFNLVPVVVFKNVRIGWRPESPIKPGNAWYLEGDRTSTGEGLNNEPSAEYLQADSSFVAAGWEDLNNLIDHTLEMAGIPPSTIRMEQSGVKSGVALIAEQIPLINWARSRQRPFAHYEDQLAKLVLKVGATHLGAQEDAEYRATASQLEAAASDPGLVLKWPDMYPDVPGPEQDEADTWLIQNGLGSRTSILMRRESFNREEARQHLEEIAEDHAFEQRIFAAVMPQQEGEQQASAAASDDETAEQTSETKPDDEE